MAKRVDFKKVSAHEKPELSPGFLLWRISTSWRTSIESTLKSSNLTHPQFVVLATTGWLTRKGDLTTQAEIGQMGCFDPNTTSQIIKGLEKKGLLKRIQSLDARSKNPVLTESGKNVLAQALPSVELADAQFFSLLTKNEMKTLIGLFQKLTQSYRSS